MWKTIVFFIKLYYNIIMKTFGSILVFLGAQIIGPLIILVTVVPFIFFGTLTAWFITFSPRMITGLVLGVIIAYIIYHMTKEG